MTPWEPPESPPSGTGTRPGDSPAAVAGDEDDRGRAAPLTAGGNYPGQGAAGWKSKRRVRTSGSLP